MKIIINEVPLSKNKYVNMHWAKRREYKEDISWLIFVEKNYGIRIMPKVEKELPYHKATITFNIFFKTNRKRDVANYLGGGLIAWLDVLANERIIVDDSWDCIGQPNVTFNIDKENPRTEIIIKGFKEDK